MSGGQHLSVGSFTFIGLSIILERCLWFRGFLTNTVLPFVCRSLVLSVVLHCFCFFLFICLSIFLTDTWDNLERNNRLVSKASFHWFLTSISHTWMWYCMPFLTCVTVRRILRPLSWSAWLVSRFSSSPDICNSSACSSTTTSWFTLMSGIKDCSTDTVNRWRRRWNREKRAIDIHLEFWFNQNQSQADIL